MWENSVPRERPPRSRLERWLISALREGGLKSLPTYSSPGLPGGQCPERFAKALLVGLRESEGDHRKRERLKDDGRAFRSWAESAFPDREFSTQTRFAS